MFQNILNSTLVKGSKVLGVDLFINSDGTYDIHGVVLIKNKNKISVENKFSGLKQISDIEDKSVKGLPVCLSVDGKGILFKRVEKNNKQKLIHQLLPNAKESDFFLQVYESDSEFQFISAIRKEILENLIESFTKIGVFVSKLYIGPFAVNNIIELVPESEIRTKNYKIKSDNGNIEAISKVQESNRISYMFGNDELYNDELLVYATALNFFIDFNEEDIFEQVKILRAEFQYKQLLVLLGWFALIFFLVLLMLNYMVFNKYNKQLNTTNFKYRQNIEMIKKLDTLKAEYSLKEEYFVNSGFLDASEQSYYADRIANSLPSEIQLTSLNINPLVGKFKNDKPLNFLMGKIKITGNVSQSIVLNTWVKKLKDLEWVKEVTIVDYLQEISENPAIFELEINIK